MITPSSGTETDNGKEMNLKPTKVKVKYVEYSTQEKFNMRDIVNIDDEEPEEDEKNYKQTTSKKNK